MAVNYADGTLFWSVVFYPIAAAKAAASVGAGWFTILFVPIGLAIGIAVTYFGRKILYGVMGWLLKNTERYEDSWLGWVFLLPMALFYFLFVWVIIGVGVWITWFGSIGVIRQFS